MPLACVTTAAEGTATVAPLASSRAESPVPLATWTLACPRWTSTRIWAFGAVAPIWVPG